MTAMSSARQTTRGISRTRHSRTAINRGITYSSTDRRPAPMQHRKVSLTMRAGCRLTIRSYRISSVSSRTAPILAMPILGLSDFSAVAQEWHVATCRLSLGDRIGMAERVHPILAIRCAQWYLETNRGSIDCQQAIMSLVLLLVVMDWRY